MARKNSGQHAYPTYNQAAKITARFGGENKLAELLNLSRVTVYRWQWKRPIGTDGLVPSRQVARIQELARREGILLRQEDWEPQKNSWEKDIEDDKARKEVKRLEEERKEAERQAKIEALKVPPARPKSLAELLGQNVTLGAATQKPDEPPAEAVAQA